MSLPCVFFECTRSLHLTLLTLQMEMVLIRSFNAFHRDTSVTYKLRTISVLILRILKYKIPVYLNNPDPTY